MFMFKFSGMALQFVQTWMGRAIWWSGYRMSQKDMHYPIPPAGGTIIPRAQNSRRREEQKRRRKKRKRHSENSWWRSIWLLGLDGSTAKHEVSVIICNLVGYRWTTHILLKLLNVRVHRNEAQHRFVVWHLWFCFVHKISLENHWIDWNRWNHQCSVIKTIVLMGEI